MKAVIFDSEGVLTNAAHIKYGVLADVFNKHSFPYNEEERFDLITAISDKDRRAKLAEDYKATHDEDLPEDFFDKINATYEAQLAEHLEVTEGIAELLQKLQAADIPYYLASDDPLDVIEDRLKTVGLDAFFKDRILTANDVRRPAPAPDLYLATARKLAVEPSEIVAVGAAVKSIKAADKTGAYALGFTKHLYEYPGRGHTLFEAGAKELVSNVKELTQKIFSQFGRSIPKLDTADTPEDTDGAKPTATATKAPSSAPKP